MSQQPAPRLLSLDAYRGAILLFLASRGLGHAPGLGDWLGHQLRHAQWVGCTAWDLIQPSFMFMLGMAAPFSYAARAARGQTPTAQLKHAAWRVAALCGLGIFLSSNGQPQTTIVFDNVLTQMGLGYLAVVLLERRPALIPWAMATCLLLSFALFALWPLPDGDAPFAAHWAQGTNAAAAFDRWLLNLFPRAEPFVADSGGYVTLAFVPSAFNMLAGVLAGRLMQRRLLARDTLRKLLLWGAVALAVGWLLSLGCPMVKRLWSPSFAVFSTGWTLWLLAGFYAAVDVARRERLGTALAWVGTNSIAAYCLMELGTPWFHQTLSTHLGAFDGQWGPLLKSLLTVAALWAVCGWMFRRKLFIKI